MQENITSKFVAKKLAESKIVAIFQGRHEFGPRASGKQINSC
jgi:predicted NodU family carbamoyl transferase